MEKSEIQRMAREEKATLTAKGVTMSDRKKMSRRDFLLAAAGAAGAAMLAACGPKPTPVPPTDTPVPPTDTPVPPTDTPEPLADTARLEEELAQLLAPDEAAFILHEVSRITPPERIKELEGYPERQSEQGGGFFGILPRQLEMDAVPIPDSDTGVLSRDSALFVRA
jgi:hypothetical protein